MIACQPPPAARFPSPLLPMSHLLPTRGQGPGRRGRRALRRPPALAPDPPLLHPPLPHLQMEVEVHVQHTDESRCRAALQRRVAEIASVPGQALRSSGCTKAGGPHRTAGHPPTLHRPPPRHLQPLNTLPKSCRTQKSKAEQMRTLLILALHVPPPSLPVNGGLRSKLVSANESSSAALLCSTCTLLEFPPSKLMSLQLQRAGRL